MQRQRATLQLRQRQYERARQLVRVGGGRRGGEALEATGGLILKTIMAEPVEPILDSYAFVDNFQWGCEGDQPPSTVPIE